MVLQFVDHVFVLSGWVFVHSLHLSGSLSSAGGLVEHVDWEGENDGRVLLCRDCAEGLQVSQLQGHGRLGDHVSSLLESPGRVLFSLGCNHLGSGLSSGFRLGCHRSLQLHWQSYVLATTVPPAMNHMHSIARDRIK